MLLLHITENDKWLLSYWQLTKRVGWDELLNACAFIKVAFYQPEILVDHEIVSVETKEDILALEERGNIAIRGISTIHKTPVMITFHNQTDQVSVSVLKDDDTFKKPDYESFNKVMCNYLSLIELSMYMKK